MNIAIFTDSYSPQINGVVTQIKNVSKELKKRGHNVLIVAPSENHKFRDETLAGLRVLFVGSVPLPTYDDYKITLPTSKRVKKILKEFNPDLVHVHTPFGIGWMGLRYARQLKTPVIGTYHTLIPEFLMYLPIPFIKKSGFAKKVAWKYTNGFYNKCDVITTPSIAMKKELEKNGFNKIIVLPNAIDFKSFNAFAKKKYETKTPKLLYFGRVSFEKNIEVVIFALKHLLWKNHNLTLTITGSGPAVKYLKEIVKEEKLEKHVFFQKPLHEKDLAKHVASHDIFVTASTIETQGLTIAESMATGIPCVGTDFLAIPDSIKEGKNGFLFAPFDFFHCAQKIEKLLKNPSLRKKMGKNGVEFARKFSVNSIVTETEELYAETIKSND
ncbi:MAG TPA: glycosyltransferase [archaeon]|nr:glycosyltransferase [archaeon]